MNKKDKRTEVTRMLHTPCGMHIRESENGKESRTIVGYAILFNTPSAPLWADDNEEAREVISRNAITKTLLDQSDIKMTMFHDRQLILARSKEGKGTLKYSVDNTGVSFSFDAPRTMDGDKALELVRRGDISGCSFAFSTHYYDDAYVKRTVERKDGKSLITYTVNVITGVYDFTLAADPVYPDTECSTESREGIESPRTIRVRDQIRQMRKEATSKLF